MGTAARLGRKGGKGFLGKGWLCMVVIDGSCSINPRSCTLSAHFVEGSTR